MLYTDLLRIYSIVLYIKTWENHEVPIFGILPTINSKNPDTDTFFQRKNKTHGTLATNWRLKDPSQ